MSDESPDALRAVLVAAISDACHARLGVPVALERHARDFARAQRLAGVAVEKVIIDVKEFVRREAGDQDVLFLPRIVGWSVAGYFAGTTKPAKDA